MFLKLIITANELERQKEDLVKEKEISWKADREKKSIPRRSRRCCAALKRFGNRFKFPKDTKMSRLFFKIRHDGTYENFMVKSVAGFLGGFFLTYVFFMFFVLQLNFKLSTAMIMCSIFGSILTIGLAFSYKVRCIVLLVLPQFFSKRGRQALLAYAYILAITGPAKNTLNNMSILGESLACGQEQLKDAVRQIWDVIKKPFYAIRDAIKAVVKAIKVVVVKFKEILLSIKRIILAVLKTIKSGFKFLANIMNMCNKEIGTPFERCKRVFENAITDCNAKLGPLFNWLCNITYLVEGVCYIVKLLDYLCIVVDFVKDTVSAVVLKVKQFVRHIRVMFYVRIKFSHSYHFESNHSRSMSEITTGIVTEIKKRSSGLIKIFDFMSSAASFFFIFMVVKEIDLRRAQLGKETVLPLNHRERQQYVTTSSLRLVKREKSQLSQAAMILLMATLKLSTHMATDYSLYWIMTLIRFYGRFQSKIQGYQRLLLKIMKSSDGSRGFFWYGRGTRAPNVPGLHIEGKGFLANLLKAIVKAFQPVGINLEIDTVPCLPDPMLPDYDRYIQIASLLVLCWFLAIFEPYGLRFRHSVMCYYHPQRARERAIWLYNNILRSRSTFLKFARRQLRRKAIGDTSISKVTCLDFFRAKCNNRLCRSILGTEKQEACFLCGEVFREGDPSKPIRCQTPGCPGVYCERCFADLQNLCTVCLDPIQYGDLSDVSEEKDSSGDERVREKKQKDRKKKTKDNQEKEHDFSSEEDTDPRTDDKTKLLPKKTHEKDSDYYSSPGTTTSDADTDYSYSYQDNKDTTKPAENLPIRTPFADVEKQSIPEYASMEEFRSSASKNFPQGGWDSSSSNITELNYVTKTPDPFINPSLQHLNMDTPAKDTGSKLSLLNSPYVTDNIESVSTSPKLTPCSSCEMSEAAAKKAADYLFGAIPAVKKTNSKISTESILLEELNTGTSRKKISRGTELSPQSETTFISSPRKEERLNKSLPALTNDQPAKAHPDVPELNLKFLHSSDEENICSGSTCSRMSCNCRLFRNSVKFSEISETCRIPSGTTSSFISEMQSCKIAKVQDIHSASTMIQTSESPITSERVISATTSSLISSMEKVPEAGRFSFKPATATVSVGPAIAEVSEETKSQSTGYPRSDLRCRRSCRFNDRDYYSPVTDSTLTYPFWSSPSRVSGSEDVLYPTDADDEASPRNNNIEEELAMADRLYRAKIKEYYKHLKSQQFKNFQPPKQKKGVFKRIANFFKKKKVNL